MLIVGGFGQVGEQVRRRLGSDRAIVTSTHQRDDAIRLDLGRLREDPTAAVGLLATRPFCAVLCVGALTDVDGCEADEDRAMAINATGPALLAAAAAARSIPFVFFSSDYVFDGRSGPYSEDDEPRPLCVYGRSKLAGERAVIAAAPDALIIRTTVVFGPDPRRRNFVYTLARVLREGRPLRTPDDQYSTPTYSSDLATATLALIDARASGIFHVSGPELMNRTTFAARAATLLKLDASAITGVTTADLHQRARRPLRAGLNDTKFGQTIPGIQMRNLDAAFAEWKTVGESLP